MNSNQELLSLIIRCIDFAARKHQNQRRKDVAQTPYINHPIGSILCLDMNDNWIYLILYYKYDVKNYEILRTVSL